MPNSSNPDSPATGARRIWRAFFYSLDGLRAAWQSEAAFRQELALAAILLPVALWLPATATQKALLLACVMLVLIVELLNSALEATIDHISLERHPLAGRAKDICSAAVFLALVNLVLIWGLVVLDIC